MKIILSVIVLTILAIITFETQAGWNNESGFQWRYDCEENINDTKAIIIVLHGAGNNRLSSDNPSLLSDGDIKPFFDNSLSDCAILVVPESGEFIYKDTRFKAWEYTKLYDRGAEMSRIEGLVILANQLFPDKPIFLIGASAGANMAYGVASELNNIRLGHKIAGTVLIDVISPYSVSLTGGAPNAYGNIISRKIGETLFYPFYDDDIYLQLGLPDKYSLWTMKTLILSSANDPYVGNAVKEDFYKKLQRFSTDLTVINFGNGHSVGTEGFEIIGNWIDGNI